MKRLIVNADDFGLTPGVNQAIVELHTAGVLGSTTLMASGGAFEEAAAAAHQASRLGVGCHVVLVDGSPVLPPDRIPTLIDKRTGTFRPTLGKFLRALRAGKIAERDIEAEAVAQILRLQNAGIAVTHVDTHKHTHMFPMVLRPLIRAALGTGVAAIRNPFEPLWSLHVTPRLQIVRRTQVHTLRILHRKNFLLEVRKAGLTTTHGSIGVLATGSLDAGVLDRLLAAMPDGLWELCCHPGYQDDALSEVRTRLRASREAEREALLEEIPRTSATLLNYGDLPRVPPQR